MNVLSKLKVVPLKPFSSASHSKALSKYKMLEKFHKAKKDAFLNKEDGSIRSDSPNSSEGNKLIFSIMQVTLKRTKLII